LQEPVEIPITGHLSDKIFLEVVTKGSTSAFPVSVEYISIE
jgi:hypothetical protein